MTLDLARGQFARTMINHFFLVPVTIGLAFLTALLQTASQAYPARSHYVFRRRLSDKDFVQYSAH